LEENSRKISFLWFNTPEKHSFMIVRLSISNFLSIDAPVEFSMLASKESQHLDRVAEGENMPARVLQTAAIWGGNASGKSNLCKVLDYAQHLVVTGTRPDGPTGRIPFRLREEAAKEPSRFEFEILVETEGEERMFARFVAKGTKPNQLFLHEAMDRNLALLAPVFRWFRDQLVVLEPDATSMSMEIEESNRQELRDYMVALLSRADTGITAMEAVEVPVASMGMPSNVRDDLLANMKDEDGGMLFRSPRGERFSVFRKNGELMASRIVTYRDSKEGKKIAFETSDESDGTLRLFDLAPVLHDLDAPGGRRVYVIDELDRSMHTQLTEALLEHYCGSRTKETRTQLIFTTHDVLLMDQRLLRRDEMWFIERGKHGETLLESLSDYKDVRYDKDVRKAYLEGRYSGVPRIKPFARRSVRYTMPEAESFRLNEEPPKPEVSRRAKP